MNEQRSLLPKTATLTNERATKEYTQWGLWPWLFFLHCIWSAFYIFLLFSSFLFYSPSDIIEGLILRRHWWSPTTTTTTIPSLVLLCCSLAWKSFWRVDMLHTYVCTACRENSLKSQSGMRLCYSKIQCSIIQLWKDFSIDGKNDMISCLY